MNFLFKLVLLCFFCQAALAATFETEYVDQDGNKWSQVLGKFHHCTKWYEDCSMPLSKDTSPAVEACNEIGGELPTSGEWHRFVTSFDHKFKHGYISVLDSKPFFKTFGDLEKNYKWVKFWTSTTTSGQGQPNAYAKTAKVYFHEVDPDSDDWNVLIYEFDARNSGRHVRCIKRPNNSQ